MGNSDYGTTYTYTANIIMKSQMTDTRARNVLFAMKLTDVSEGWETGESAQIWYIMAVDCNTRQVPLPTSF